MSPVTHRLSCPALPAVFPPLRWASRPSVRLASRPPGVSRSSRRRVRATAGAASSPWLSPRRRRRRSLSLPAVPTSTCRPHCYRDAGCCVAATTDDGGDRWRCVSLGDGGGQRRGRTDDGHTDADDPLLPFSTTRPASIQQDRDSVTASTTIGGSTTALAPL